MEKSEIIKIRSGLALYGAVMLDKAFYSEDVKEVKKLYNKLKISDWACTLNYGTKEKAIDDISKLTELWELESELKEIGRLAQKEK